MTYYQQNKEIYNNHKTKCFICGENAKCCLEFHHIKPKNFNISNSLKHITPEQLLKEFSLVECVCSNCHKKIHNGLINISDYVGTK